jgi:hypothetical protein
VNKQTRKMVGTSALAVGLAMLANSAHAQYYGYRPQPPYSLPYNYGYRPQPYYGYQRPQPYDRAYGYTSRISPFTPPLIDLRDGCEGGSCVNILR